MNQEWAGQVRKIMAAARPQCSFEAGPRCPLFTSAQGVAAAPSYTTSTHRARKTREILRIADRHGWHSAVTHFLDTRGAEKFGDLSDPQLDDLLNRMQGYVDAAQTGCDPSDALPAR